MMSSNTRLTLLKHSIANSFIRKESQNLSESFDDDDFFCIVPVETKRGDERASRSSSRRKKRERVQRDQKLLSAKCLWPNLSEEEKGENIMEKCMKLTSRESVSCIKYRLVVILNLSTLK